MNCFISSRLTLGPPRIHYGESTNQTQVYSYVGNPSSVTINCVWWGFPKPTLSIRKDNEQLPSKDVSIKTTKLLSYLQATVLTNDEEDFGTYTCHASNEYGSATHLVIINKAGELRDEMGSPCPTPEGRDGILIPLCHF